MSTQIRAFQIHPTVFALFGASFNSTAGQNLSIGRCVRVTGDGLVGIADKASAVTARAVGITASAALLGNPVTVQFGNLATIEFELGLTLVFGDRVYVGVGPAGMATNVPSVIPGEANMRMGIVSDSSTYNPVGPSPQYAEVAMNLDYPVVV